MLSYSLIWSSGECVCPLLVSPVQGGHWRVGCGPSPGPARWWVAEAQGARGQVEGAASGHEGGEALEQVAQRSCGCPFPASVQGQEGWGFQQPGLVEVVPAHSWGRWTIRSLKVPSNPSHAESMSLWFFGQHQEEQAQGWTWSMTTAACWEGVEKMNPDSSQKCSLVGGWAAPAPCWQTEKSQLDEWKRLSPLGCSDMELVPREAAESLSLSVSKHDWTRSWATWPGWGCSE